MDNKILEALSQVPELVETTKTMQEIHGEQSKMLGELAKRNVNADIPESEIEKVTIAVEETVKNTPCALPDAADVVKLVSEGVITQVQTAVATAIEEKVKSTPLKLEHHHTHATTYDMARLANDWAQKWLITLLILCCMLALVVIGGAYWYYTSEQYWGKEYSDVFYSDYTTEKEKELMWNNVYAVGMLPKEYHSNPEYVKAKIKQNKTVLKKRREQAANNSGKFKIGVPLER